MPCTWKLRSPNAVPPEVAGHARALNVSPLIAEILWSRGLSTREDMDRFLSPGLRHLAEPGEIPGLTEAARALAQALAEGRRLAVWGDYDVDGLSGVALVKDFFARRGVTVGHHVPNRLREGYGLNVKGVERLAGEGFGALLTVDCGVSNVEEIRRANELGLRVVVSDHHLPGRELPAAALCNPRLAPNRCEDLAGVGVAFMLVAALNRLLPGEPLDMRQFLDLVVLGTVADVVRLTGQNRILVKNGLLLLKEPRRPGVAALKAVSGYDTLAELGAGQIGFQLAPRLNAAGRLGDPGKALDLLLAPDPEAARPLAEELNALNAARRKEEQDILDAALAEAEAQVRAGALGLVLFGRGWHPGVIGIVASRVVERHYRPTLLVCEENGRLKGSGRSIEEFDLHAGLVAIEDLFSVYGGHRQAAGFTMEPKNLPALRERFDREVGLATGGVALSPTLKLDRVLGFRDLDQTLLAELELLQPFGVGNPEPVFGTPPVVVRDHKVFGTDHVRLLLHDAEGKATLSAKAWRKAQELTRQILGKTMRFAYTPKIDRFNGIPRIELTIRDWNF
jgi:single-stranded-DNA-specific exonuclease